MKLQHFTKSQIDKNNNDLLLTVNLYSYNIIFDRTAIQFFNLKKGEYVCFSRDVNTGQWFFYKTKNDDSFALRRYGNSDMLAFTSKELCRQIAHSIDEDAYKLTMKIEKEAIEFETFKLYKIHKNEILERIENFVPALANNDPSNEEAKLASQGAEPLRRVAMVG